MNTNKLKSNEIIGKRQLFNLKGGTINNSNNSNTATNSITINSGSISNLNLVEGGDETDKRAKRPGII